MTPNTTKNEMRCLALKHTDGKWCTRDIKPDPDTGLSAIVCWQHNDDFEEELIELNVSRQSSLSQIKAAHRIIFEKRSKQDYPFHGKKRITKNLNLAPKMKGTQVSDPTPDEVKTDGVSGQRIKTEDPPSNKLKDTSVHNEIEEIPEVSDENIEKVNVKISPMKEPGVEEKSPAISDEIIDKKEDENSENLSNHKSNSEGAGKEENRTLSTQEFVGILKFVAPLFAVLSAVYTYFLYWPDFNFLRFAQWEDFIQAAVNPFLLTAFVFYIHFLSVKETQLRKQDEYELFETHAVRLELEDRTIIWNRLKENLENNEKKPKKLVLLSIVKKLMLERKLSQIEEVNPKEIEANQTEMQRLADKLSQSSMGYLAENINTLKGIGKMLLPLLIYILIALALERTSKCLFKQHVYILSLIHISEPTRPY